MVATQIEYSSKDLTNEELINIYRHLVYPRLIEEKMLILLRQGKISKWFSGIGQEAIAVGATMALDSDEIIFPMHRNLGVFTTRGIPLERLIGQWQGKPSGFTKGRDRSFHFGTLEYGVVGMISHLGAQLSLADGVALSHRLRKEEKVALAFTGEGGTSEGEFHEALNVAAVWNLPVIFLIENNGYGLSTPTSEQYKCKHLAHRGKGYGIKSEIIDGNNVLEVYHTIRDISKKIKKKPQPYLLECQTFRMRGHEEASGIKYVPSELLDLWSKKDPIHNFEHHLITNKVLQESEIEKIKSELKETINKTVQQGFDAPSVVVDLEQEMQDVYQAYDASHTQPDGPEKEMRMIDAISNGLDLAMEKHDELVLMGQDIAEYGGVFKITDGFVEKYGKGRVRNTPICESAIIGAALGLSLKGIKSMVEMQFSDFVTCGFNQIVNNLAKIHYRWGQNADVVIRMPTGGSVSAGPFHSQSTEAWFTHTAGLKVVYPSTPEDAKGLLLAALEDPNPVLYYEHKALYRKLSASVSEGYYTTPIGKARIVREGTDVSIITYGLGVVWAEALAENNDVDIEIIDLRTLSPLDYDSIDRTVTKTGRVIILHEANQFGGIGGEIASYISEHLFEHLDAPVTRVASLNTPIPFSTALENQYLPIDRLQEKLTHIMNY